MTISAPSNTLLTPSVIAREALMILQNNTVAAMFCGRELEREFTREKVGDSVTVSIPPTYDVNSYLTSSGITVQDTSEGSTSLRLDEHLDTSVGVTSEEWTLELDSFSRKVIKPVMVAWAEYIDTFVLNRYQEVPYYASTLGSLLTTHANMATINQKFNDLKMPRAGRIAIVDTANEASILGQSIFVSADDRGQKTSLEQADIGRLFNTDWFMDQNIPDHTAGTAGGSTVIKGAVSAGATTLLADGAGAAGTLKRGDIFTVAGASGTYTVLGDWNESTRSYDNYTADGAGEFTSAVSFYPEAPTGGFDDDAAITFIGDHSVNLGFIDQRSIALALVPLSLPRGAQEAYYMSDNGFGIRVVVGYDMDLKSDIISFDLLIGAKAIQPELAFRF